MRASIIDSSNRRKIRVFRDSIDKWEIVENNLGNKLNDLDMSLVPLDLQVMIFAIKNGCEEYLCSSSDVIDASGSFPFHEVYFYLSDTILKITSWKF